MPGAKPGKKRPDFDNILNIKKFDVFDENQQIVTSVKERVATVTSDSKNARKNWSVSNFLLHGRAGRRDRVGYELPPDAGAA